ncbi:hypothetical protein ACEWPL_019065 [Roseovarius sp. S1116L3]
MGTLDRLCSSFVLVSHSNTAQSINSDDADGGEHAAFLESVE